MGLSRTGSFTIAPTAAGNVPTAKSVLSKFERTLLEFHSSEFHEIFSVVRTPARLSNAVKIQKFDDRLSRKNVVQIRQTPEFKN